MKILLSAIILPACLAIAAEARASSLRASIESSDGWVSYEVPIVAGAGAPCCFAGHLANGARRDCDLDARDWGFHSGSKVAGKPGALTVYWHVADGRVDKLRAMASTCAVSARTPIRRLPTVDGAQSTAAVAQWLGEHAARKNDVGGALAVLAYHADADATRRLSDIAAAAHPQERRQQALFWLAHARGADGAAIVEKATGDADPEIREHAVFALSESQIGDAYDRVHSIAQHHADSQLRGKALFWMAQMDEPRAAADILAALRRDPSVETREEAVFALSQLDEPAADEALIAVIRGDHPRAIKERALFWLGQSGSPRALDFIDEVLTRSVSSN